MHLADFKTTGDQTQVRQDGSLSDYFDLVRLEIMKTNFYKHLITLNCRPPSSANISNDLQVSLSLVKQLKCSLDINKICNMLDVLRAKSDCDQLSDAMRATPSMFTGLHLDIYRRTDQLAHSYKYFVFLFL